MNNNSTSYRGKKMVAIVKMRLQRDITNTDQSEWSVVSPCASNERSEINNVTYSIRRFNSEEEPVINETTQDMDIPVANEIVESELSGLIDNETDAAQPIEYEKNVTNERNPEPESSSNSSIEEPYSSDDSVDDPDYSSSSSSSSSSSDSESDVENAIPNETTVNGTLGQDNRGKHLNHKAVSEDIKDEIRSHISSIPSIESHYTRAHTEKTYIEGSKTIAQLYRDYKSDCVAQGKPYGNLTMYRKIFNYEFNIAFFVPKKDQCQTCVSFQNSNEDEKKDLEEEYKSHVEEKNLSREGKNMDKSKISKLFQVACFDLEATLPTPNGQVSSFYYRSKLSTYNFTICDIKQKGQGPVYCYMWHEGGGKRGAIEIGTCLLNYLKEKSDTSDSDDLEITLYSDNCAATVHETCGQLADAGAGSPAQFKCLKCTSSTNAPKPLTTEHFQAIMAEFSSLKITVNACEGKITACDAKIETLNQHIASQAVSIANCETEITNLKTETCSLRKEFDNLQSKAQNFEDFFEESRDRTRRECNVIVSGLRQVVDDKAEVQKILTEIGLQNISPKLTFRFGKANTGPKPLKVIFSSSSDAMEVLKAKSRLTSPQYKSVTMKSDLTPRQVQHLSTLRKELQKRTDEGEDNLTIKYIRGVPRIVSLRSDGKREREESASPEIHKKHTGPNGSNAL
ncbi:unnamed protein product [Ceutorhynchus assimilis]|uniref:Uncharacterized protein n=1 Tax=Ceutorhynchus assimilis TaxID=467358 RepID=A0A9N9MI52_9CUCU|nr:unnamed protein product [Ceutorhynchus assimilis]